MFSWIKSKIPALGTIKTWVIVALGSISAILYGMYQSKVAKMAKAQLRGAKQKQKAQQADANATIEGLQNETYARNNIDLNDDDKLI